MKDHPVGTNGQLGELSRREMLSILGAAGATALGWPAASRALAGGDGSEEGLDCVVTPAQTEGPVFRRRALAAR